MRLPATILTVWFVGCSGANASEAATAAGAPLASAAPAESAIADALRARGVRQPEVLLYLHLANEFDTTSGWALAVVRERDSRDPEWIEYGPLFICFLKEPSPACLDQAGNPAKVDEADGSIPYEFQEARVVQAAADGRSPRLLVKTCTESSGDGDCAIHTTLYAYDRAADRFEPMFHNATGHNRNQRTRFVEDGPIRGDIIVDEPTANAPYTYWVEVFQPQGDGRYARVLRYRGRTEYSDGNVLAVADSEMPEVLRRLGFWKSGDPLPIPPKMPAGCTTLFLRKGVEWCK